MSDVSCTAVRSIQATKERFARVSRTKTIGTTETSKRKQEVRTTLALTPTRTFLHSMGLSLWLQSMETLLVSDSGVEVEVEVEVGVEVDCLFLEHFVDTVTDSVTVGSLAPSPYTTSDSDACKAAPSRHYQCQLREESSRLKQHYLKPTYR